MIKALQECLNNQQGSYILPFFWQHGEEKEKLAEEIEAIAASGAKEFCVESRVHEEFCEDKWWEDFEFILKEAEKRDMKVWLLDDKRFPTGYANGELEGKDELKKTYIRLDYIDVVGPKKDNALLICDVEEDEKIISVSAYKRTLQNQDIYGDFVSLTNNIQDSLVFWDIPEGVWRVYFVVETRKSRCGFENYIDMLNPESCRILIDAVYEPHYKHFSEYFGNTFVGFFSDEPSFTNDAGHYNSKLGTDMLLPWKSTLLQILTEKMGKSQDEVLNLLPLLWAEHTDNKYQIRYCYMNLITVMYKENFSMQIGDWCRSHNVMYIGHVIEDMNTHMRLGHGAGHFFRALDGQDMAGCDVVLNQMIPGIKECFHTASVFDKCVDPEFFTYTLAKLASSHSHIQGLKNNRAMCEIFGAFGWAEGVPMMKLLADHMLVSGINYFVPHAFNIKYPDFDCPPHFYIGGKNPQFEYFSKLTVYMQRMSHILSGGVHKSSVAVFYNAEAEWCGGDYTLFQKVSKHLLQNQIDFDFIPTDYLKEAEVLDGKLVIEKEKYDALIVSYSEVLPLEVLELFENLNSKGLEVIFCDKLPDRACENVDISFLLQGLTVCKTEKLAEYLTENEKYDISVDKQSKYLRFYHTVKDDKDIYMFSNEDVFNSLDVYVRLKNSGKYIEYEAWDNTVKIRKTDKKGLRLVLGAGESVVLIFDDIDEPEEEIVTDFESTEITPMWKIYTKADNDFELFDETSELYNIARRIPRFCGVIRYEANIYIERIPNFIELGNVGEIAKLEINGENCGESLFYPYKFDVKNKFKQGENRVVIEVVTNLAYRERDVFSKYLSLPPSGMTGPVKLVWESNND